MPRQVALIYTEPRDLEGNPFQVAGATASQAVAVLRLAVTALEDTWILARVAQLEREAEPSGIAFERGPLGKRLEGLREDITAAWVTLEKITGAISYDPNNPPKEA